MSAIVQFQDWQDDIQAAATVIRRLKTRLDAWAKKPGTDQNVIAERKQELQLLIDFVISSDRTVTMAMEARKAAYSAGYAKGRQARDVQDPAQRWTKIRPTNFQNETRRDFTQQQARKTWPELY